MSYIDLRTYALVRRNEMESRINSFRSQCEMAQNNLKTLIHQADSFLEKLNCSPSELKERYLNYMQRLNEYIYFVTDFNMNYLGLELYITQSRLSTPVHDDSIRRLQSQEQITLFDAISEPLPSTSGLKPQVPKECRPKKKRAGKEDCLIDFSSNSASSESVSNLSARSEVDNVTASVAEVNLDTNQDSNKRMSLCKPVVTSPWVDLPQPIGQLRQPKSHLPSKNPQPTEYQNQLFQPPPGLHHPLSKISSTKVYQENQHTNLPLNVFYKQKTTHDYPDCQNAGQMKNVSNSMIQENRKNQMHNDQNQSSDQRNDQNQMLHNGDQRNDQNKTLHHSDQRNDQNQMLRNNQNYFSDQRNGQNVASTIDQNTVPSKNTGATLNRNTKTLTVQSPPFQPKDIYKSVSDLNFIDEHHDHSNMTDKDLVISGHDMGNNPNASFIQEDHLENQSLPGQTVLEIEQIYICVIVHVSKDPFLFFAVTENVSVIEGLYRGMTEHFSSQEHSVLPRETFKKLVYCACLVEDEDMWYRCLVNNPQSQEDEVELFFVDLGELKLMPYRCIRILPSKFTLLPPIARMCHLTGFDLIPSKFDELEKYMRENIISKKCSIIVEENETESLGVSVILSDGSVLGRQLALKGLVVAQQDSLDYPEHDNVLEAVQGYVNRDEIDICKFYKDPSKKTCFKGARCTKKHIMIRPDGWTLDQVPVAAACAGREVTLPPAGSELQVRLSHVAFFNAIYVHLIDDKKEKPKRIEKYGVRLPPSSLEELVYEMNTDVAISAYRPLSGLPALGELVAAVYPQDGNWYRAKVTNMSNKDHSLEVQYVDYGNRCWVRESDVRHLDQGFQRLPFQAIRCKLAGVQAACDNPEIWTAAKDLLHETLKDKILTIVVLAASFDELEVDLFQDGFRPVEQLITMKMVTFTDINFPNYEANRTNDTKKPVIRYVVP